MENLNIIVTISPRKGNTCVLSDDIKAIEEITGGYAFYNSIYCENVPSGEQIHAIYQKIEKGASINITDKRITRALAQVSECEIYPDASIEKLRTMGFDF